MALTVDKNWNTLEKQEKTLVGFDKGSGLLEILPIFDKQDMEYNKNLIRLRKSGNLEKCSNENCANS